MKFSNLYIASYSLYPITENTYIRTYSYYLAMTSVMGAGSIAMTSSEDIMHMQTHSSLTALNASVIVNNLSDFKSISLCMYVESYFASVISCIYCCN